MDTDTQNNSDPGRQQAGRRYSAAFQQSGVAAIVLVTCLALATPYIGILRPLAPYTLHALFALLGLGLFFFVTDRARLMMTAMYCAGALGLFLKSSSNQNLRFAAALGTPSIRVAHINLGNAEGNYDEVIAYLEAIPADVLMIQELTPDWEDILPGALSSRFPHQALLTRLDPYGIGLFSAPPLIRLDTLWFRDIPTLTGTVDLGAGSPCHIITCQMMPPVNQAAYAAIADHLHLIAAFANTLDGRVIVTGDFHLPPWSAEVQQLKDEASLQDSRRDVHTRNVDGSVSMPRIPVDHILYDRGMECASFSNLGDARVGRLGITGTYHLTIGHAKVVQ